MEKISKILDFLYYIEKSFIDIGFTKIDDNNFSLGHYNTFIVEDESNIDRIGIRIENQKYIQDDNIDIALYDIRTSITYFNFKSDTEKELYRRFNAVIIGKIKGIPSYEFLLRSRKIENIIKNKING